MWLIRTMVALIMHSPYGHEDVFSGLYAVLASLSKDVSVDVVFIENGAYALLKGQDSESNIAYPCVLGLMDSIVELGGRLFIHKPSAEERGITKGDIAEQIEFVNDDEVVELISKADSAITF